jgi:hypothetical protein
MLIIIPSTLNLMLDTLSEDAVKCVYPKQSCDPHFAAPETQIEEDRTYVFTYKAINNSSLLQPILNVLYCIQAESNANQCCGAGMFIPDPVSWILDTNISIS